MFDSMDELLRKIRLGEDTCLELKTVRFKGERVSAPAREDLADEIAAMANTHDGVVVLGVDDKTREAVRYRGGRQDSNFQVDAQRICGPLDAQINQSMAFLKRNQSVGATKAPGRIEIPQFSERAVFEAVENAVAHRDYAVAGSKIRFFMFDDRLEIFSPGALPNTVTVDNISLRQATRNELITSLLAETPVAETLGEIGRGFFMEKRGDGVPIILYESEKLSGKRPEYRLIDESELLLTIFAARKDESERNGQVE